MTLPTPIPREHAIRRTIWQRNIARLRSRPIVVTWFDPQASAFVKRVTVKLTRLEP